MVGIVEIHADSPLLDDAYEHVLSPSFPADELETLQVLRTDIDEGRSMAVVAVDGDCPPLGAAVGSRLFGNRVLLLSYLAVRPGTRSQGIGGRLLATVTGDWQRRFSPCLTLAEVEHPRAHADSTAHGDPVARLRFYARHGALALDLPYFQPALRPDSAPVFGMLLVALAVEPGCEGELPGTVSPAAVEGFLADYGDDQAAFSTGSGYGSPAAGTAVRALRRALNRRSGIPLIPLGDPAALPVSWPAGPPDRPGPDGGLMR